MKKIRCDVSSEDYLRVSVWGARAHIDAKQGAYETEIALSPSKIRKLRKQLKRALIEIEGESSAEKAWKRCDCDICVEPGKEQAEEYKPGDRVYLIEGHNEGDDWCTSPTVVDIDLSIPVELKDKLFDGKWGIKYTMLDGDTENGFAHEKSFGRRA